MGLTREQIEQIENDYWNYQYLSDAYKYKYEQTKDTKSLELAMQYYGCCDGILYMLVELGYSIDFSNGKMKIIEKNV